MTPFMLWVWLGCAGGTTSSNTLPTELTTPPVPGSKNEFNKTCMDACLQQNMARAVSADLIEEQCAKQCSQEDNQLLPESKDAPKI